MIGVKLVLCRLQILIYTMSLSQTWRQCRPCVLLTRRAVSVVHWLLSMMTSFFLYAHAKLHFYFVRHSTPAKYSKQLAATSHCPFSKNERKSNHPTKVHTQTLGKQVLLDHTPLLSFSQAGWATPHYHGKLNLSNSKANHTVRDKQL